MSNLECHARRTRVGPKSPSLVMRAITSPRRDANLRAHRKVADRSQFRRFHRCTRFLGSMRCSVLRCRAST